MLVFATWLEVWLAHPRTHEQTDSELGWILEFWNANMSQNISFISLDRSVVTAETWASFATSRASAGADSVLLHKFGVVGA